MRRTHQAALCAAVFTAPFTGIVIAELLWLSHIFVFVAFATATRGSRNRRRSIETELILAGIATAATGLITATVLRNDGAELLRFVGLPAASALTMLLVISNAQTEHRIQRLAGLFVSGVIASACYGMAWERTPAGHIVGLTGHKNQMAMTIVIAAPLAVIALQGLRHRFLATATLLAGLAFVLMESGSRSGLMAGLLVGGCLAARWALRQPSHLYGALLFAVAAPAALVAVSMAGYDLPLSDDNALVRLMGAESSANSNEKRQDLLEDALDLPNDYQLVVGSGELRVPRPHNIIIDLLLTGGALAVLGLAMFCVVPLYRFGGYMIGAVPRSSRTGLAAAAIVGWLVIALANNLVWAPFLWVPMGLFAASTNLDRAERGATTRVGALAGHLEATRQGRGRSDSLPVDVLIEQEEQARHTVTRTQRVG